MDRILIVVILVFVSASCDRTNQVTVHGKQDITFRVEVADNLITHTKGLMFRKELGQEEGMLFVFKGPSARSFWMKNTRIPLDIIFINREKEVVNVEEANPCELDPCKRYYSRGMVQYVLEINQGLSNKYGIKEGTRVEFILN